MDWQAFGVAMREAGKERRASNRDSSATILRERGIAFEERNDGAHLIVRQGNKIADFWPGTGKWCMRGTSSYRRGVFKLIAALAKE